MQSPFLQIIGAGEPERNSPLGALAQVFGRWTILKEIFAVAGKMSDIPPPLLAGVRKGAGGATRKAD